MAKRIVIIGGLDDPPTEAALIAKLTSAAHDDTISWSWLSAGAERHFQPQDTAFRRLLHEAQAFRGRPEQADPASTLMIAKLHLLHGRTQSQLLRCWPDPVLVPASVRRADDLVAWIVSPAANLVPRREWPLNVVEAALVSILCKLLGNKSFNKDQQGHAWTTEANLLGQWPVERSDLPMIRHEAESLLDRLEGSILLTKGANQGKTKKEWCINTQFLPMVKQAITAMDFEPLRAQPALIGLLADVENDNERTIVLGSDVIKERVREICRS